MPNQIIDDILGIFASDAIKEAARFVINSLNPADLKYLRFRTTGTISLEDENLVERAKAQLDVTDPTIVARAEEKLEMLESHQQDYVRLVMVGMSDPEVPRAQDDQRRINGAREILTLYANMTTPQWQDHVEIMNFNIEEADSRIGTALEALQAHPDDAFRQAGQQIANQLHAASNTMQQLRQNARHGWQPMLPNLNSRAVLIAVIVVAAVLGILIAGGLHG